MTLASALVSLKAAIDVAVTVPGLYDLDARLCCDDDGDWTVIVEFKFHTAPMGGNHG